MLFYLKKNYNYNILNSPKSARINPLVIVDLITLIMKF